jgi:Fibronectin type III domain
MPPSSLITKCGGILALTPPGKVLNPRAVIGFEQLTLQWDTPDSIDPIISYNIRTKETLKPGSTLRDYGNVSTNVVTVTGLTNGISYDFIIAAINKYNRGPYSDVVSGKPGSVPGIITSFISIDNLNTELDISSVAFEFIPPISNGYDITQYTIKYRLRSGLNPVLTYSYFTFNAPAATNPPSKPTCRISGLLANQQYDFSIAAINQIGTAEFSSTLILQPGLVPRFPTDASGNVPGYAIRTESSSNNIRFFWNQYVPLVPGEPTPLQYVIQYTPTSGATSGNWIYYPALFVGYDASYVDISYGVLNGQTYYVRYAAINENGRGNFTNIFTNSTGSPGSVPRTLDYININRQDSGARVGWGWLNDPSVPNQNDFTNIVYTGGYPIIDYRLIRYNLTNDPSANTPENVADYTVTTLTVGGLVNGNEYLFKVRPRNILGYATSYTTQTVIPVRPASIFHSLGGSSYSGYIELTWVPPVFPQETGGLPIRRFIFEYRLYNIPIPSGTESTSIVVTEALWNSLTTPIASFFLENVTATTTNVLGLVNGEYYIFRATSLTYDPRVGEIVGEYGIQTDVSGGSGYSSYTPSPVPAGEVPFGVSNLAATVGDSFITVTWGPPSIIGSKEIISYILRYKISSQQDSDYIYVTIAATERTYTIVGLVNGTEYKIQMYAKNIIGTTSPTIFNTNSASLFKVPGRLPDLIALETQYAIIGKSSQITLDWATPNVAQRGGYPITNYFIQRRELNILGNATTDWLTYSLQQPQYIEQYFTSKSGGVGDSGGFIMTNADSTFNTYLTSLTNTFETTAAGGQIQLFWRYGGIFSDTDYKDSNYNINGVPSPFVLPYSFTVSITLDNTAGATLLKATRNYVAQTSDPYYDLSGSQYIDMSANFDVSSVLLTTNNRLFFQLSYTPDTFINEIGLKRSFTIVMKRVKIIPPKPYTFVNTNTGIGSSSPFTIYEIPPINPPIDSSYVMTGLADGTIYNFRIASRNEFGTTGFSNSITRKCGRVPYKIGTSVEGLYTSDYIVYRDNSGVGMVWNPPASGGYDITSYNFLFTVDPSGRWLDSLTYTPLLSDVSFTTYNPIVKLVTDVSNFRMVISEYQVYGSSSVSTKYPLITGNRYYVKMAAVNDLGVGEYTDLSSVIIGRNPETVRDLSIIVGNNYGRLIWRVPSTDNGYPIYDYAVQYRPSINGIMNADFIPVHRLSTDPVTGYPQNTLYPAPIESLNPADPLYSPMMILVQSGINYYYTSATFTNQFDLSMIALTWKYTVNTSSATMPTRSTRMQIQMRLNNSTGPVLVDTSGTYNVTASEHTYYFPVNPYVPIVPANRLYMNVSADSLGDPSINDMFNIVVRGYSMTGIAPLRTTPDISTNFTFLVGGDENPLIFYDVNAALRYKYAFRVTPVNFIDYAFEAEINDISNIEIGTAVSSRVTDLAGVVQDGSILLYWSYGNPNLVYDFYVRVDDYRDNPWPILPDLNHSLTTDPVPITRETSGPYTGLNKYVIHGLVNGQFYYLSISPQVVVSDGGYSTLYNAPESNVVMIAPGRVPNPVTSITTRGGVNRVIVTWIAPTDPNAYSNYNNPTNVEYVYPINSYIFQTTASIDTSGNPSNWTTHTSYTGANLPISGQSTTVTVTGLINELRYYYRVIVINSIGESVNNTVAYGDTSAYPFVPRDFTNLSIIPLYQVSTTRYLLNISFTMPQYNGNALIYGYKYEYTNSPTTPDANTVWIDVFDETYGIAIMSDNMASGQDVLTSVTVPEGGTMTKYIVCKSGIVLTSASVSYIRFNVTGYIVEGIPGPNPARIVPIIYRLSYL